jgi:hypothetical protein
MVEKIFEIIDYFNPDYYIIENPATGRMKEYINNLIPYYDIDYCKYSDWGYKKSTRFWTNIEGLEFARCKNDCNNIVNGKHKLNSSRQYNWDGNGRFERYRIPSKIIEMFFNNIN